MIVPGEIAGIESPLKCRPRMSMWQAGADVDAVTASCLWSMAVIWQPKSRANGGFIAMFPIVVSLFVAVDR